MYVKQFTCRTYLLWIVRHLLTVNNFETDNFFFLVDWHCCSEVKKVIATHSSQGAALEVLITAVKVFFILSVWGLNFNSLRWIIASESVWTEGFVVLFIECLWRDFDVSLMGCACLCFLAVGIGRSMSFRPLEKYIFTEHYDALYFSEEIFKIFALGNQMHISCTPPDFVLSPRKQQFLLF